MESHDLRALAQELQDRLGRTLAEQDALVDKLIEAQHNGNAKTGALDEVIKRHTTLEGKRAALEHAVSGVQARYRTTVIAEHESSVSSAQAAKEVARRTMVDARRDFETALDAFKRMHHRGEILGDPRRLHSLTAEVREQLEAQDPPTEAEMQEGQQTVAQLRSSWAEAVGEYDTANEAYKDAMETLEAVRGEFAR